MTTLLRTVMDMRSPQVYLRIHQAMSLLAVNPLAGVIGGPIGAELPYSALLTLWL
jgi:hypothetical protein